MSKAEWAENEIRLACKKENPDLEDGEWDYGCECYKSALKAFKSLCDDGHSGFSFQMTKNILIRLMEGLPLTLIEDIPENWSDLGYEEADGTKVYQCKRMTSLFKELHPDGSVTYTANNYYAVDDESGLTYTGGGVKDILDQYVKPIELPWWPPAKKYEVHTREYLTDRKNGDFDTKEYSYILCPDGKRIEVNRYFAEGEDGWREITWEEYYHRVQMDKERQAREESAADGEQRTDNN